MGEVEVIGAEGSVGTGSSEAEGVGHLVVQGNGAEVGSDELMFIMGRVVSRRLRDAGRGHLELT